jgi:aerobic carbon-monoxide dehydrogenase medium subunit
LKPAAFAYHRPSTVDETVAVLADDPGSSRVLAGGQSLVLEMNYRRARPGRLVDINGVAELNRVDRDGDRMRVGALARHARFEDRLDDGALGRLLSQVSHHIGHPPIRSRGTMVGSLSYAHPAAELVSASGARSVPARSFFEGPFATSCRPDELVSEVRLPVLGDDVGVGFVEHRRTHASFAVVAAVAVLDLADGEVRRARIGIGGGADRPLRADEAEGVLVGAPAGQASFAAAAAAAAAHARPVAEPHCSVEFRRHAVAVVVRRALEAAAADGEIAWT